MVPGGHVGVTRALLLPVPGNRADGIVASEVVFASPVILSRLVPPGVPPCSLLVTRTWPECCVLRMSLKKSRFLHVDHFSEPSEIIYEIRGSQGSRCSGHDPGAGPGRGVALSLLNVAFCAVRRRGICMLPGL